MMQWLNRLFAKPAAPIVVAQKLGGITTTALEKARRKEAQIEEFAPYEPPVGVIPAAKRSEAMAMDATPYDYVNAAYVNNYFPGYQYLAMLAQLPEYRKMSDVIAKEMTRKWIKLRSKGDDDDKTDKIAKIEDALEKYKVRALFRKAAEIDGLFGRAQIFIDVEKPSGGAASDDPQELESPLFMASAKIKKGALKGLRIIEPVWTYPSAYNATDPLAANYYRPQAWYVMGKTIHTSRLLRFVSREVPDMLKAAYNFGGLSMSQMAQPYVQNFIRTRDSVSDVVHSFSVSGLRTNMASVLSGTDDAQFFARAQLFNTLRDNRGLMMLDKDSEEFFQFNTPLGGLDSLQAQSQEQMSSVSSIPLVKLLGITPSGLNASSDGEIQVFYDHIASMQAALFADPLTKVLQIIQLSEFGEIDPDIVFEFETLYGMDDVEKATVRKTDADTDAVLVSIGAISPDEARARLAADPESGYDSLEGEIDDGDDEELEGRKDQITATSKISDK
jgi:phage-related protein (TIGR01555 family)